MKINLPNKTRKEGEETPGQAWLRGIGQETAGAAWLSKEKSAFLLERNARLGQIRKSTIELLVTNSNANTFYSRTMKALGKTLKRADKDVIPKNIQELLDEYAQIWTDPHYLAGMILKVSESIRLSVIRTPAFLRVAQEKQVRGKEHLALGYGLTPYLLWREVASMVDAVYPIVTEHLDKVRGSIAELVKQPQDERGIETQLDDLADNFADKLYGKIAEITSQYMEQRRVARVWASRLRLN